MDTFGHFDGGLDVMPTLLLFQFIRSFPGNPGKLLIAGEDVEKCGGNAILSYEFLCHLSMTFPGNLFTGRPRPTTFTSATALHKPSHARGTNLASSGEEERCDVVSLAPRRSSRN